MKRQDRASHQPFVRSEKGRSITTRSDDQHRGGIQFGDGFHPAAAIRARGACGASALNDVGVRRGDVVATLLRNDVACFEVAIAAATLGAHIVPINWHAKSDEVRYVLEDSGAKVLVAHVDLLSALSDAVPPGLRVLTVPAVPSRSRMGANHQTGDGEWNARVEGHGQWPEPPQVPQYSMNYTSGTTGRPKGVRREPMTDQGRAAAGRMFSLLRVGPEMRTIVAAPLYHAAPFGFSMAALSAGAFIVLMERFDASEYLRNIERYKINNLQMVPTMFVRLLKLPEHERAAADVSSLEIISHGAAPCPPQVKQAMIEWVGPIIYEFYAASELGLITTLCSSEEALAHPGTVGKPVEGATVRILDDRGAPLPPGQVGEIAMWVDGTSSFTYHGNEEKRRSIQREELVTCGDVGYLDEEGYLYLTDRKSDMAIVGGANVYPAEVEHLLIGMPGVLDCAVFGVPDEDLGEVLAAVVQPEPGTSLTQTDVIEWLKPRIAITKVPRAVIFRDELPREDSGKLFKRRLREEVLQTGR